MKKPLLVLIVALGLMRPAWADFQDGWAALQRGDYQTALREWRLLAEQGNASAQSNLGFMYATGQGATHDRAESVRWYRRASEQGVAEAQLNLGLAYMRGLVVTQDYAEAARWLRGAAEQGVADAQFHDVFERHDLFVQYRVQLDIGYPELTGQMAFPDRVAAEFLAH